MLDIQVIASGSKGNCYLIDDGSSSLLIECGTTFKKIQRSVGRRMKDVSAALITHEHMDHARAINEMADRAKDVYLTAGTLEALEEKKYIKSLSQFRLRKIKALTQFRVGTFTILPFETEHDAREPVGFLIQSDNGAKLLYATDTYYIRYKFKGLTHLMVEVNYCEKILRQNVLDDTMHQFLARRIAASHLSLQNYEKFLKANDLSAVEQIHLIHISDTNGDAALFKERVEKVTGKLVFAH